MNSHCATCLVQVSRMQTLGAQPESSTAFELIPFAQKCKRHKNNMWNTELLIPLWYDRLFTFYVSLFLVTVSRMQSRTRIAFWVDGQLAEWCFAMTLQMDKGRCQYREDFLFKGK